MKLIQYVAIGFAVSMISIGCGETQNPISNNITAPQTQNSLAQIGNDSSSLTIVHGIPGAAVDVFVNGDLVLDDFMFGTVTSPLRLEEGTYEIVIELVTTGDTVFADSVFLPRGVNVSAIAHLSVTGSPTLSVFLNDVSPLAPGKGRLVFRHVAALGPVDVDLYKGARTKNHFARFEGLSNPNEVALDLRPGRYTATISEAGGNPPLIQPSAIQLRPKESYLVYAVGSGTLAIIVQKIYVGFVNQNLPDPQ